MEGIELLLDKFGWAGLIMSCLAAYIVRRDTTSDLTRKEQEARLDKIYGELFQIQKDTVTALTDVRAELGRLKGGTT